MSLLVIQFRLAEILRQPMLIAVELSRVWAVLSHVHTAGLTFLAVMYIDYCQIRRQLNAWEIALVVRSRVDLPDVNVA